MQSSFKCIDGKLFSIFKNILKPKWCGLTDDHFKIITFSKQIIIVSSDSYLMHIIPILKDDVWPNAYYKFERNCELRKFGKLICKSCINEAWEYECRVGQCPWVLSTAWPSSWERHFLFCWSRDHSSIPNQIMHVVVALVGNSKTFTCAWWAWTSSNLTGNT